MDMFRIIDSAEPGASPILVTTKQLNTLLFVKVPGLTSRVQRDLAAKANEINNLKLGQSLTAGAHTIHATSVF